MAKMNNELVQRLKSMPNNMVDLIVWTQGDATPHLEWLASEGLKVTREFKLKPGVAVTCSGADALKLLDQDWVMSVNEDEDVGISD